jgi:predicted permease
LSILELVLPVFVTIGLGYLCGRISKADLSSLVVIATDVALPCLIFVSMISKPIVLRETVRVWAAACIIIFGVFALAFAVFRILKQKHSGLFVPIVFINVTSVPLSVVYLAFGQAGAAVVATFYIPSALLAYTVGTALASRGTQWKGSLAAMLRMPLLWSAVLGLAVNLTHLELPALLLNPLKFVGQAAIPMVLLALGISVSRVRIAAAWHTVLLASVLRVGGGFLLGIAAVAALGLTGVTRSVVLFESAMPSAVFASVICARCDNEANLVASVVLVTTLMSVAAMPLLLRLLL